MVGFYALLFFTARWLRLSGSWILVCLTLMPISQQQQQTESFPGCKFWTEGAKCPLFPPPPPSCWCISISSTHSFHVVSFSYSLYYVFLCHQIYFIMNKTQGVEHGLWHLRGGGYWMQVWLCCNYKLSCLSVKDWPKWCCDCFCLSN